MGVFGGRVWLWAAVLEMASELGGGWDSPDSAGSLGALAGVYTLEHMHREIASASFPCEQESRVPGGPGTQGLV